MADGASSEAAAPPSGDKVTIAKLSAQLKKINEANGKYKNLLKLAKERIQQQESELEGLQAAAAAASSLNGATSSSSSSSVAINGGLDASSSAVASALDNNTAAADEMTQVVRVCQCVKEPVLNGRNGAEEIWALLESETLNDNDEVVRRSKEWKRFHALSELSDHIRRDSGEPIGIPEFSLSPAQSASMQEQAQEQVQHVTEEFRRFRVKAELARKQADAQLKTVQTNNAQSVAKRLQPTSGGAASGDSIDRLQSQMAAQEAHWQDAYNKLLDENKALQSTGSEALLASQWRQRYEQANQEKDVLQSKLQAATTSVGTNGEGGDKYELKYRDLKESFRLYRKKAKEIFESQQRFDGSMESPGLSLLSPSASNSMALSENSSADAKLSYLRNLMVNYLTADQQVRDHMEGAIGTVLQFSPDQRDRIDKKREENESWFYGY